MGLVAMLEKGGMLLKFWAQRIQALLTLPDLVHTLTWGKWWTFNGKALDLAGDAFDGWILMAYGGLTLMQRA